MRILKEVTKLVGQALMAVGIGISPTVALAESYQIISLPDEIVPTSVNAGGIVAGYYYVSEQLALPIKFSTQDGSLTFLDARRDGSGIDALLITNDGQVVFDRSVGVENEIVGAFFDGEAPQSSFYGFTFGDIKLKAVNSSGLAVGYGVCSGSGCATPGYGELANRALLSDMSVFPAGRQQQSWSIVTENSEGLSSAALDINDSDLIVGALAPDDGSTPAKAVLFNVVSDGSSGSGQSLEVVHEFPSVVGAVHSVAKGITNDGLVLIEHLMSNLSEYKYTLAHVDGADPQDIAATFQGMPVQIVDISDNHTMIGIATNQIIVTRTADSHEWKSLDLSPVTGLADYSVQQLIQINAEGMVLLRVLIETPGPDTVVHLLLNPIE